MRLLHVDTLEFQEFDDEKAPSYAIASHRWQGEEVKFQDVKEQRNKNKKGYEKVKEFAKYIRDNVHGVEWLWIDTCCINKDSAAELSEAINLMFKWYQNAKVCLAYLADVIESREEQSFRQSEWFERGWTLQELLAPRTVVFLTSKWQVIGNKGASSNNYSGSPVGPGLERAIASRTGVPEQILHNYRAGQELNADERSERFKWMEGRKTSRPEDMSYALYGIFGVTPGVNYGEGHVGAKRRLLADIRAEEDVATQRAKRFREIVAWLSPPDPWTNHDSARDRHERDTGTWLLECDAYRDWKSGSLRHLWIYGKAGCGKTVLCFTAIEDMLIHCKSTGNAGCAAFYMSFSDNRKQRYEDALLSWVAQLCWKEPALSMLRQAYEKPGRETPRRDELEKILVAGVETHDEVFILVDALDECPEDGDARQCMMECLARLSDAAPRLRILATSRELSDIRESMLTLQAKPVSIETHSVDADIRKYVTMELSRTYGLSRLDAATKALIEDTLSKKADGMFRWAYCQLQELKKLKSTRPKAIEKALYSLPATLDETYERMLAGIDADLRSDALKLLRWLAYAKSPPSLGQLVHATVIDLDDGGHVELDDKPGLEDTLEILSALVTIIGDEENVGYREHLADARGYELEFRDDEDDLADRHQQIEGDTKVRLAHFSVKEYLESKRILEGSAKDFYLDSGREHQILCQSCLTYLQHYSRCEEKLRAKQDFQTFPLLEYAAKEWFYHSALQQVAKPTSELGLLCDEVRLRDWLMMYQPDQRATFQELDNVGSDLYYASVVGLKQVVKELLDAGADVNAQGGRYGNALQAALIGGHEKVVQTLLDAEADVNAPGGDYGNALQAASFQGDEKVVQTLLDAGADVNAPGGDYGNALQAASLQRYEKVVQTLLDAGADVNAQGGFYGNALQAASYAGREKVVQTLLDAGADVNAQGGIHSNALQAALARGDEKVVQMLLDAGADVNAQGGFYSNALQAASHAGCEKVVQTLLDAGADVNAQGGIHSNALQAALAGGDEKVVQMLLDAGADVNAQGGRFGNALQAASDRGHEKIVQTLLDAGAKASA